MKKILVTILLSTLIVSTVACGNDVKQQENKSGKVPTENTENDKKDISVEIIGERSQDQSSGLLFTFKPKLNGKHDKELQYHWIIENINDFEGFRGQKDVIAKEIINEGEPVELVSFAEVTWIPDSVVEFKVKLQVEDKETGEVIAASEVTIVNREGVYGLD